MITDEPSFFTLPGGTTAIVSARRELAPTPRLAAWLMVVCLGLMVDPLVPGAWLFTVCASLLVAALAVMDGIRLRAALALEPGRARDPVFSLGVANRVGLSLYNPTLLDFDVEIVDEAPPQFRTLDDNFKFHLGARTAWEGMYHTTPDKRGDYQFGGLNVRARTTLGFLSLSRRLELDDRAVRVYPNLRDVKALSLLSQRDQWLRMGIRTMRGPFVGREFESLRDYQTGDEWRTLDWKASARRHKLTVRNYDVEHSQKILLVLDLGRTMSTRMGDLSKADVAINACVLLTAVAARLDDRVGMLAFADKIIGWLPPARGKNQATRLLDFLYPLEAVTRESDYRKAFGEITMRLRSRTLVVVFTDLVDAESSSQLIAQLGVLASHHAVLCVALSDHELEDIQDEAPQKATDLYRRAVASSMLDDRDQAVAQLSQRGVRVLKARPDTLSVDLVNRYLQWKRTSRLTK